MRRGFISTAPAAGGGGGAANFVDLGDVPASYVGHSLKLVRVNVGETGLEFMVGVPSHVHSAADITSGLLALARGGLNLDASGLVRGDLLRSNAAATAFERLGLGSAAQYLRSNGVDPVWAALSAADLTGTVALVNGGLAASMTGLARGDILRSNAAATAFERLALGASGRVLKSDGTDAVWGVSEVAVDFAGSVDALNPADSTTYFWAHTNVLTADSNKTRLVCPVGGRVVAVYLLVRVDGTLGTGETVNWTFRKNGADTAIVGTTTWDAADAAVSVGLGDVAISAGDTVGLKVVTPAWATNPTTVRHCGFSLRIEQP